jgi:hypothetical protein
MSSSVSACCRCSFITAPGWRGVGRPRMTGSVAVWECDDRQAHERIDAAVRVDPPAQRAQERRARLPEMLTSTDETFMSSMVGWNYGPFSVGWVVGKLNGHLESSRAAISISDHTWSAPVAIAGVV